METNIEFRKHTKKSLDICKPKIEEEDLKATKYSMCTFNQENLLQLPIILNQYSGPSWECSWMFKPGPLHGADGQQGHRPHGRGVWQGGPGKHIQWSAYI